MAQLRGVAQHSVILAMICKTCTRKSATNASQSHLGRTEAAAPRRAARIEFNSILAVRCNYWLRACSRIVTNDTPHRATQLNIVNQALSTDEHMTCTLTMNGTLSGKPVSVAAIIPVHQQSKYVYMHCMCMYIMHILVQVRI